MNLNPSPVENPPTKPRAAVTLIFFINGVVVSSWVARIPELQRKLGISEGELGLALLGLGLGALVALVMSGWLVGRMGSRPVTTLSVVAVCALLPGPALAPSTATLTLALFIFGAANGALDVAMNAQGVLIQRHYGRPILSSMHAAFSFGAFTGAAVGGLAAAAGITPTEHLLGAALVLGVAAFLAARWLLPAHEDVSRGGPSFVKPSRRLAALGTVAFCGLLIEGAVADWSAVYLNNVLETGPALAAAGFAAFSLTMAAGRLIGDRLVFLTHPITIARYGGTIALIGLMIALLAPHPLLAIGGFALVGAGLSNIVPIVFTAAGRISKLAPGPAIAAVATTGYFGFLTGPPVIGLVAELLTLRVALLILVILAAVMTVLSGTLKH